MKFLRKKPVVLSFLLMGLLAVGCANIPNVDPAAVYNQFFGNDAPLDTDMDGLSDDDELIYGTNPTLQDTDGDGFNDWKEVVNFGFNPAVNPYAFNPLVADLPNFDIEIFSPPVIVVDMEAASGTTKSVQYGDSTESSEGGSHTDTWERGLALEVETQFGFTMGVTGAEGNSHLRVQISGHSTWTDTDETNWEEKTITSTIESFENSEEITQIKGRIRAGVQVINRSNYSYKVENMVLAAFLSDPTTGDFLEPVGQLIADVSGTFQPFPDFTIGPGQGIGPIVFVEDDLDLPTTRKLIKNRKSLAIVPIIAELSDAQGVPLIFNMTEIENKTATVAIDYGVEIDGNGISGRPNNEVYNIATRGNPDAPGMPFGKAINEILLIDYEYSALENRLISVRGVSEYQDGDKKGSWIVSYQYFNGLDWEDIPYDSLEDIVLNAGEVLSFTFTEDSDGDGMTGRIETIMGLNAGNADTDGDGMTDLEEFSLGLDPSRKDSDWDGLNDRVDPDPYTPNYYNIGAGYRFSLLVDTSGNLYSWGLNDNYQLGLGDTGTRYEPTLNTSTGWAYAGAGGWHGAGIKTNGALYTWGTGSWGELGQGDSILQAPIPAQVGIDYDWVDVSLNLRRTHAMKYNGTHWAWGDDSNGALGVVGNPAGNNYYPLLSYTYSDRFFKTSAGGFFHLGIKNDGTLWASGNNLYGQLGTGGNTNTDIGVQIGTDDDWAFVNAGGGHSLAIKSDGSLWGWGNNMYGKLGIGMSGGNFSVPLGISSGPWINVASSTIAEHNLAIKADGSLWAWGLNNEYQLGLGHNISPITYPRRIGSDNDWIQISAAFYHSLAMKSDGTVWAWGRDAEGEVGDGNANQNPKSVPVCIKSVVPGGSCPTPPWTWIKGSNLVSQPEIKTSLGIPANTITPGARSLPGAWIDSNGNLWVYGGAKYESACVYHNDLWVFDRQQAGGKWAYVWPADLLEPTCNSNNYPPGNRIKPISLGPDANGNLWLFGGLNTEPGITSVKSDLWKFSPSWNGTSWSASWTQVIPSNSISDITRMQAAWTDKDGNFWLFGGGDAGLVNLKNSLWKFEPGYDGNGDTVPDGLWTKVIGSLSDNQVGVYGDMGVPNAANIPGSRWGSATWTDAQGNLWLYGGHGYGATSGIKGYLDDLWKYNIENGTWTWMGGTKNTNKLGKYNNPLGYPGGRASATAWTDSGGKLMLFGGYGYDESNIGDLNDLWRFDPTLDNNGDNIPEGGWTWLGGSYSVNQYGTYGTQGTPAYGNIPGARHGPVSFYDASDETAWIFGGYGYGSTGLGSLNDLWRYDP